MAQEVTTTCGPAARQIPSANGGAAVIALLAHEGQQDNLVALAREFLPVLKRCTVVSTVFLGGELAERMGLTVDMVYDGDDRSILAAIAERRPAAIIALQDSIGYPCMESPTAALLWFCNTHQVPLATNLPTARAILAYPGIVDGCGGLFPGRSAGMAPLFMSVLAGATATKEESWRSIL